MLSSAPPKIMSYAYVSGGVNPKSGHLYFTVSSSLGANNPFR